MIFAPGASPQDLERVSSSAQGHQATAQKTAQKGKFCIFFGIFWARDHVQRLLQALASNFPSKMPDLDAYVSRYDTFQLFGKAKLSSRDQVGC